MSKFLNRPEIVEAILEIIDTAETEIILIVPYIKLSDNLYHQLKKADKKGVEISIIYREEKLNAQEKEKLICLENLNLFSHAEIHAKCYVNEWKLLITSMNLYDYSEKYNREMGVILEREWEDSEEYLKALKEVREIIKSSKLEKKSKTSKNTGFRSKLLTPAHEKLVEPCKLINKYFDNKRFEVFEAGLYGEIRCIDYYENIDVLFEPDLSNAINDTTQFKIHRVAIEFKWDNKRKKMIQEEFWVPLTETMFESFKVYWDYYSKNLTIYRDRKKQPKWDELNLEQTIIKFRQGIELVADDINKIEKRVRQKV
jgi:hypothetical protein